MQISEQKTYELEDRWIEILQSEQQREKIKWEKKKDSGTCEIVTQVLTCSEVSEWEKKIRCAKKFSFK